MSSLRNYHFEVGGIRKAPGRLQRYRIAQGTTQELSMIDAFRKVTGDHASQLCKRNTYCKIVSSDNESVTIITQ